MRQHAFEKMQLSRQWSQIWLRFSVDEWTLTFTISMIETFWAPHLMIVENRILNDWNVKSMLMKTGIGESITRIRSRKSIFKFSKSMLVLTIPMRTVDTMHSLFNDLSFKPLIDICIKAVFESIRRWCRGPTSHFIDSVQTFTICG